MNDQRLNPSGAQVRFTYRNHRGEISERHVTPARLEFTSSAYHREMQWILVAWDHDKNAWRSFAMAKVTDWRPA